MYCVMIFVQRSKHLKKQVSIMESVLFNKNTVFRYFICNSKLRGKLSFSNDNSGFSIFVLKMFCENHRSQQIGCFTDFKEGDKHHNRILPYYLFVFLEINFITVYK